MNDQAEISSEDTDYSLGSNKGDRSKYFKDTKTCQESYIMKKKRKRLIESDLYYQYNVGIERILRIWIA